MRTLTKFVRPARWMEWIAEENQGGNFIRALWLSCHLRGDATAHRFATDCQAVAFQLFMHGRSFDYGKVARLEFRLRIRHAATLFHVNKVEGQRVDATFSQSACEQTHKRM